jgi:general secretion pathway protein G
VLQRIRAARQKKENGFTLIELLVVIIILGVLAGIVVFAVRAVQDHGEAAACKADYNSTVTAVEAYYAKNTAFATKWSDLVPDYLHNVPNGGAVYTITAYKDGAVLATGKCSLGSAGTLAVLDPLP